MGSSPSPGAVGDLAYIGVNNVQGASAQDLLRDDGREPFCVRE